MAAIDVDMTLNRYLDHDPNGRMFVLESDLERVRAEERQNAAARTQHGEPAVTIGLAGDAIQPLTVRARPGECLVLRLRNALVQGEPVSLHLHGGALRVISRFGSHTRSGPAIAANPDASLGTGDIRNFEWAIPSKGAEGTHLFHSHALERQQNDHGLWGTVVVEPASSTWLDPRTGADLAGHNSWDALIRTPDHPAVREFVLYYQDVGDESYQSLDGTDFPLPLVDPITSSYRPGGRALSYRSEPFLNRLRLGQQQTGRIDESLEYSSYAFGDPATPIMRSYLGDPVEQRVVHAGSEVFHVHHVHGGATRWLRQPGTETKAASGLNKHPALTPKVSERTDSQSLGPSETFDVVNECGSGGCQQSVGDYLYHCHIAHHYFAGMWGIWRVYNTLQDGEHSTDGLRPLPSLGGTVVTPQPAVPVSGLVGRPVEIEGAPTVLTAATAEALATRELPPPGLPHGYDATVWDWRRELGPAGPRYLSEPESTQSWPGYRSAAPGRRLELGFDPRTGKLAYPFLRPHLGARPPFAPNHGPSPYLDPVTTGTDPPSPGRNGNTSTCPTGTVPETLPINAISVPVTINAKDNLVDPHGELFVLRSQEDQVRAQQGLQVPLAIRANAGESCIDVLLRSELTGDANNPLGKVGLHIHFVQFDVQGSDGLDTGFNYEQTVRPFRDEGAQLDEAVAPGALRVRLGAALGGVSFQAGAVVGVGVDQDASFESRRVAAVDGDTITFTEPLAHAHASGEVVSAEFVRYRWYPDAQFGTAYFHDHVNGLFSWQHGLFGALIAEPPGATYTDPHTGEPLLSGAIADIHTAARVSTDVSGSFRELAMFIQDDNPITHVGRSAGSSFNLRAEPLSERSGDPSLAFSSLAHGDPATPLLEANVGDPVVVRSLVGGTNDVHTWHVDGHWFRAEAWSSKSPPINTIHLGISERQDLVIPRAGGPQQRPADYLYYSGRTFKLREGSWGILRVHSPGDDGSGELRTLPGHETPAPPPPPVCPPGAPVRRVAVSAEDVRLPMLGGALGKVFVLDALLADVKSGRRRVEPLVVHINVGDCLRVHLTNNTGSGPVSYHCDLLSYDPTTSGGVNAGRTNATLVGPRGTGDFVYYASPDVGETVSLVRDWGDVTSNPGLGLYGAVVVGPRGTRYTGQGWSVDAHPRDGAAYRDFTLFLQDEDAAIGTHRMPYTTSVSGPVGINYEAAPFQQEVASAAGYVAASGLPPTPLMRARVGDPTRIHVLAPWSEQAHVFSVEGHRWPVEPGQAGTTMVDSLQVGGLEAVTLRLDGGAGGADHAPGDYLYGDHRAPYFEAGMWGLLRVVAPQAKAAGLASLSGNPPRRGVVVIGAVVLVMFVMFGFWIWRRGRQRPDTGSRTPAERFTVM